MTKDQIQSKPKKRAPKGALVVMPYERQPKETSQAFDAFCLYRDLHPIERSYARVEADLNVDVRQWARATDWQARAAAWDDHRDKVVRAAELTALSEMRAQQLAILETGHAIVNDQINLLAEEAIEAVDKNGNRQTLISPTEIRQWIDSMIKLKALFAGEPTSIEKVEKSEELDLSGLSVEELQELKKLQNKAKGE